MGNCSTQAQQISTPTQQQQPIIPQTQFIKPDPSTFVLSSSILENKEVYAKQGIKSKITNLGNNVNENVNGSGNSSIDWRGVEDLQVRELQSVKKGTLFVDHVFKAEKKSIGEKLVVDHVQWKRPDQFLKSEPILFQLQFETYDLKPGRLQNFYLVSAFAALSLPLERLQQILQQVFNSQSLQTSQSGGYIVNLFIDGEWRTIVIDDQLPIVFGQYIFSNYRQQLWMWLIQKSLAKYYRSYQNIQRGLLGPTLAALTGAPYQYFNVKSSQLIDIDKAWEFVRSNMAQGNIMAISTENVDRNQYFGLPANFSYFVLDSQEVYILTSTKKKRQRILKLDNPWGRYQWKGRWSEYSDVWSEQLRHQLDYEKADDSIMWINIEDLVKNFGQICVCKWKQQYVSTCISIKYQQEMESEVRGVFINVAARTEGYLSVIQKDHRNYNNKPYQYSMAKLILLQMQKQPTLKPTKILHQKIDSDHYCTIPIELNPGLYYLLIDMDWNCSFSREISIQIYADHCVNLEQDKNMPNGDALFYQLAMLDQENNQLLQVYVYPHDQNIKRIKGVFGGYVYYHYVNNSKDNKYLAQTVKLDGNSKNVVITGQKYADQYAVKLLPNQQKLVKMKITNQANGQYSFNPVIRNQIFQKFSNESLLEMLRKKPSKVRQRQIEHQKIEVFVKTFEYSGGVALLYSNQMSQHSYIEQITFDTTNLQIENETLEDNCRINIQLEPHGEKMFSFVVIEPSKSYTFKTRIQYYLGTPQFKF